MTTVSFLQIHVSLGCKRDTFKGASHQYREKTKKMDNVGEILMSLV